MYRTQCEVGLDDARYRIRCSEIAADHLMEVRKLLRQTFRHETSEQFVVQFDARYEFGEWFFLSWYYGFLQQKFPSVCMADGSRTSPAGSWVFNRPHQPQKLTATVSGFSPWLTAP